MAKKPNLGNGSLGALVAAANNVKLGPGVLGRTAPVCIVALLVVGMCIWQLGKNPSPPIISALVTLALFSVGCAVIYSLAAFIFAALQPGASVLEESHLVQYAQVTGTRDQGVIDAIPIENPALIEGAKDA